MLRGQPNEATGVEAVSGNDLQHECNGCICECPDARKEKLEVSLSTRLLRGCQRMNENVSSTEDAKTSSEEALTKAGGWQNSSIVERIHRAIVNELSI